MRDFLTATGIFFKELPLELASLLVVPVALAQCKPEDEKLPEWAAWWDELDFGINGDPYWKGTDHANGAERTYWWRVRWLFRNRLNTYSKTVSGFATDEIVSIGFTGDPKVSNRPGREGELHITATLKDGTSRFEHYIVKRHGSTGKCMRIRYGWKLKDVLDEFLADGILHNDPGTRKYIQFVWAFTPFMTFEVQD